MAAPKTKIEFKGKSVKLTSGKDSIWFDRYPEQGRTSLGLNVKSWASVSGRWDIDLIDDQLDDLIEKLKELRAQRPA